MKLKWLDRTLIVGPYLVLCKTEKELAAAFKHCNLDYNQYKSDEELRFPDQGCAKTFRLEKEGAEMHINVVALGSTSGASYSQVLGILAHEASHVVDDFFEAIRETNPSSEFKAYCTQAIVENLVEDYRRKRT